MGNYTFIMLFFSYCSSQISTLSARTDSKLEKQDFEASIYNSYMIYWALNPKREGTDLDFCRYFQVFTTFFSKTTEWNHVNAAGSIIISIFFNLLKGILYINKWKYICLPRTQYLNFPSFASTFSMPFHLSQNS